jgi:hypothetical protein
MDPLEALRGTAARIWGVSRKTFFEEVLARVKQWNPKRVEGWKEIDYQKALVKTFRPSDVVEIDQPKKGCDIEVRWLHLGKVKEKIAIEIKLNNFSVKDLIGGIDIYRKDYNGIIVVLLGNPPVDKVSQIKSKLDEIKKMYGIPTYLELKKF